MPQKRLIFSLCFLGLLQLVSACAGQAQKELQAKNCNIGPMPLEKLFPLELHEIARATCDGDKKKISRLISEGISPNEKGLEGLTLLVYAMHNREVDALKTLLKNGADPNLLFSGDPTKHPVIYSTNFRTSRYLRLLLEAGGDPNAVVPDSYDTALTSAFELGVDFEDFEQYYMLLDAGADINMFHGSSLLGGTIVDYAAGLGRHDKVHELLEKGYTGRLDELLDRYTLMHNNSYQYTLLEQRDWAQKVYDKLLERELIQPSD